MTLHKKRQAMDPVDLVLRRTVITRLGCWECMLKPSGNGYVPVMDQRGEKIRVLSAHRVIYEHFNGPIPGGLQMDHLCRNRICCNPDHLEAVTARVNQLRSNGLGGVNARKTHCPQGHPYKGHNLFINTNGRRCCRACSREAQKRSEAKRRASV